MPPEAQRLHNALIHEIRLHLMIPLDQIQMLQQLTVVPARPSYIPEDLQPQIDIVLPGSIALFVGQDERIRHWGT